MAGLLDSREGKEALQAAKTALKLVEPSVPKLQEAAFDNMGELCKAVADLNKEQNIERKACERLLKAAIRSKDIFLIRKAIADAKNAELAVLISTKKAEEALVTLGQQADKEPTERNRLASIRVDEALKLACITEICDAVARDDSGMVKDLMSGDAKELSLDPEKALKPILKSCDKEDTERNTKQHHLEEELEELVLEHRQQSLIFREGSCWACKKAVSVCKCEGPKKRDVYGREDRAAAATAIIVQMQALERSEDDQIKHPDRESKEPTPEEFPYHAWFRADCEKELAHIKTEDKQMEAERKAADTLEKEVEQMNKDMARQSIEENAVATHAEARQAALEQGVMSSAHSNLVHGHAYELSFKNRSEWAQNANDADMCCESWGGASPERADLLAPTCCGAATGRSPAAGTRARRASPASAQATLPSTSCCKATSRSNREIKGRD